MSNPAPNNNAGAGKDDYLDKTVGAIEKKFGVDPNKYKAQNEKFTDKLRGLFEKKTGKKVPSKISN